MSNVTKNTLENPDRTAVAKDVFTYCTREKSETWHVVVAQNAGGFVDRVQCKSCGSHHRYRMKNKSGPSQAAKTLLVRKATSGKLGNSAAARSLGLGSSQGSSKSSQEIWFDGIKAWGDKPVIRFNASHSFAVNDVFEHEVFGKGVVQARRENKIDVLFQVGVKTLPSKQ